jgi:hypothetical protein
LVGAVQLIATVPVEFVAVIDSIVGALAGATVVWLALAAVPAPTPLLAATVIVYPVPGAKPPIEHVVPLVVQVLEFPPAVAVTK